MQAYSANDPRQTIKNIWGFDPFSQSSKPVTSKVAPKTSGKAKTVAAKSKGRG